MAIEVKELSAALWPELERFFTAEECSGCWCMNHRVPSGVTLQGEPARLALADWTRLGKVTGVLAFDGIKPIGWCAFDRMIDLPGLDCGYPVGESQRDEIWAINCFSVLEGYDEAEVSKQMLSVALMAMERSGAKRIEGYPPPSVPSDNSFSGTVSLFEKFGFRQAEQMNKHYVRMIRQGR